jgi:hypothetical protein
MSKNEKTFDEPKSRGEESKSSNRRICLSQRQFSFSRLANFNDPSRKDSAPFWKPELPLDQTDTHTEKRDELLLSKNAFLKDQIFIKSKFASPAQNGEKNSDFKDERFTPCSPSFSDLSPLEVFNCSDTAQLEKSDSQGQSPFDTALPPDHKGEIFYSDKIPDNENHQSKLALNLNFEKNQNIFEIPFENHSSDDGSEEYDIYKDSDESVKTSLGMFSKQLSDFKPRSRKLPSTQRYFNRCSEFTDRNSEFNDTNELSQLGDQYYRSGNRNQSNRSGRREFSQFSNHIGSRQAHATLTDQHRRISDNMYNSNLNQKRNFKKFSLNDCSDFQLNSKENLISEREAVQTAARNDFDKDRDLLYFPHSQCTRFKLFKKHPQGMVSNVIMYFSKNFNKFCICIEQKVLTNLDEAFARIKNVDKIDDLPSEGASKRLLFSMNRVMMKVGFDRLRLEFQIPPSLRKEPLPIRPYKWRNSKLDKSPVFHSNGKRETPFESIILRKTHIAANYHDFTTDQCVRSFEKSDFHQNITKEHTVRNWESTKNTPPLHKEKFDKVDLRNLRKITDHSVGAVFYPCHCCHICSNFENDPNANISSDPRMNTRKNKYPQVENGQTSSVTSGKTVKNIDQFWKIPQCKIINKQLVINKKSRGIQETKNTRQRSLTHKEESESSEKIYKIQRAKTINSVWQHFDENSCNIAHENEILSEKYDQQQLRQSLKRMSAIEHNSLALQKFKEKFSFPNFFFQNKIELSNPGILEHIVKTLEALMSYLKRGSHFDKLGALSELELAILSKIESILISLQFPDLEFLKGHSSQIFALLEHLHSEVFSDQISMNYQRRNGENHWPVSSFCLPTESLQFQNSPTLRNIYKDHGSNSNVVDRGTMLHSKRKIEGKETKGKLEGSENNPNGQNQQTNDLNLVSQKHALGTFLNRESLNRFSVEKATRNRNSSFRHQESHKCDQGENQTLDIISQRYIRIILFTNLVLSRKHRRLKFDVFNVFKAKSQYILSLQEPTSIILNIFLRQLFENLKFFFEELKNHGTKLVVSNCKITRAYGKPTCPVIKTRQNSDFIVSYSARSQSIVCSFSLLDANHPRQQTAQCELCILSERLQVSRKLQTTEQASTQVSNSKNRSRSYAKCISGCGTKMAGGQNHNVLKESPI